MSSENYTNDEFISSDQYKIDLGNLIRTYRLSKRMTQEKLGSYCQKSKQQISDIENGKILIDSYTYDIIEMILEIPHNEKPLFINYKVAQVPTLEQVQLIKVIKKLNLNKESTKHLIHLLIELEKAKGENE